MGRPAGFLAFAKHAAILSFAVIGVVSVLLGVWYLWQRRSWRPALIVNGREISFGELTVRGESMMGDARDFSHVIIPKDREREALRHYMRTAAKLMILKETLLAEAVARGITVTPEDERAEVGKVERKLKAHYASIDEFFRDGPLDEATKRRDFRESLLVMKLIDAEYKARIKPATPEEIDRRLKELTRLQLARTPPGGKPPFRATRKVALDTLAVEKNDRALHELFRELFAKTEVRCPAFPEYEVFENVSPEPPPREPILTSQRHRPAGKGK